MSEDRGERLIVFVYRINSLNVVLRKSALFRLSTSDGCKRNVLQCPHCNFSIVLLFCSILDRGRRGRYFLLESYKMRIFTVVRHVFVSSKSKELSVNSGSISVRLVRDEGPNRTSQRGLVLPWKK